MNTLLSNVDRIVSKFSSLNQILENVTERVLPSTSAKAGYSCYGYCGTYCHNHNTIVRQNFIDCIGSMCRSGCACDKLSSMGTC